MTDFDLLSQEARARLEGFTDGERKLVAELLSDARTELQREMLQRALAAGHGSGELHAFADEIRAMSDDHIFAACTLEGGAKQVSVVQRLRAEADPIYGFLLNGHELSPRVDSNAEYPLPGVARRPKLKPPPALMVAEPSGPKPKPAFEMESSVARGKKLDAQDLGKSPDFEASPSGNHRPKFAGGREAFFNEAVRALGLSFREHAVDGPSEMNLEAALESAAAALTRGVPVPVALGNKPGEQARYVLMLQTSTSGKSRAFQLHDPRSQETVWVNEGDLFARSELPFANKSLRRITAVALPVNRT